MQNLIERYEAVIIAIIGVLFQIVVLHIPTVRETDFIEFVWVGFMAIAGLTKFEDFGATLAVRYNFGEVAQYLIDAIEKRTNVDLPASAEAVIIEAANELDVQLTPKA